ncbi:MAG TPA: hypothetical protein PK854_08595 [Oscillospiraceae bacterium]|nr:hypothetical protein [Oscillospiraceae bacterium]HPS35310.1 hypothetical protein [Oscillospiraceae bacterium]
MAAYLNNCPVCGGKTRLAVTTAAREAFYCECPECDKSTDEFLTEEEAVNAWNNSAAADLKDTDERILLSVVMRPVKTWISTFERIFTLLLGPVLICFLLLSFNFNLPVLMWLMFSIILILWLCSGIPLYIRFAGKRNRLLKHIPIKSRSVNRLAVVLGYVSAVFTHAVLFIFVFWPIIAVCRQQSILK